MSSTPARFPVNFGIHIVVDFSFRVTLLHVNSYPPHPLSWEKIQNNPLFFNADLIGLEYQNKDVGKRLLIC